MSDVFISYSRKDSIFVQRLTTSLVDHQRLVWVDWQAIPAGEDWWREIELGIENAETFVVVISENWLLSNICHQELEYARNLNKRILPVIHQNINSEIETRVKGDWMDKSYEQTARDNWNNIGQLNWIIIDSDEVFEAGFARLIQAIDEDQPHLKAHTRYQRRALEWKRSEENPSFLLVGDDLIFAEKWLTSADNGKKSPFPTDLHRRYITDSRHSADETHNRELARERRIQQFRIASVILGVIGLASIVATAIAIPTSIEANNNNATSIAQVETAANILITATSVVEQVGTSDANLATAANVLVTATSVVEQVGTSDANLGTAVQVQATAIQAQENAESAADDAQTQVAIAGETLTPVPPTLTAVASAVAKTQRELDISTQFALVEERFQNGEINAALRIANQVIDDYPNEITAYIGRASLYQDIGEIEKAIPDYDMAITLNPERPQTYNSRALAYQKLGNHDEAFNDFATAIRLNPNASVYYTNRGNMYSSLGDKESAIEDFNRAIEINAEDELAYMLRAGLFFGQDNLDKALDDINRAIELNPLNPNAYNTRASIYTQLGDLDTALQDYNSAIELEPEYATYYGNRAFAYRNLGNIEAALLDYDIAIQLEPENAFHYASRASSYMSIGEMEEALQDFNTAIRIEPLNPSYYNNRFHVNKELGNIDAALNDLTTTIELDANRYPNAYLSRALLHYENENYELALLDINQYVDLNPDDAGAYEIRGVILINFGDYETAISDFDYMIDELTPSGSMFPTAYVNRGVAYYYLTDYEQALADFDTVTNVVPNQLYAIFNRGLTYLRMGNLESAYQDYENGVQIHFEDSPYPDTDMIAIAITDLNNAIEEEPENGDLYLFRGYLYHAQGQTELAEDDWNTVDELGTFFIPEIEALR